MPSGKQGHLLCLLDYVDLGVAAVVAEGEHPVPTGERRGSRGSQLRESTAARQLGFPLDSLLHRFLHPLHILQHVRHELGSDRIAPARRVGVISNRCHWSNHTNALHPARRVDVLHPWPLRVGGLDVRDELFPSLHPREASPSPALDVMLRQLIIRCADSWQRALGPKRPIPLRSRTPSRLPQQHDIAVILRQREAGPRASRPKKHCVVVGW
eukprot:scaffold876_cov243-Pinguiococcus_pyrenoidosus.AAC.52